MPPKPAPAKKRNWPKPGWAGGKAGDRASYEDVLGSEGFPTAHEPTLFEGSKAKDRSQGRRLRDDSGHEVDAGTGNGDPAAGPLTPERIDLLKQTKRTVAPEERRRLDEADLKQEGLWIHRKLAQAALEIQLLQGDKKQMANWLNDKGIRFDTQATYSEGTLQQLIHYWHLLPTVDQQQIALAKPLFFVHLFANPGDVLGIKGSSGMGLTTDEEVVSFIGLTAPSALSDAGLEETFIDGQLAKGNYDISAAAIKQRWYQSGYVKKNEFDISDKRKEWHIDPSVADGKVTISANDIFNTATFAHEMTHMRQDLVNGVYALEKDAANALVRFAFHDASSSTVTRVWRAGAQDPDGVPAYKRNIRSLARREERLAYTSRRTEPNDPTSSRVERKIGSHDGEPAQRQPLVQQCVESLKRGLNITRPDAELDPKEILGKMHRRIKDVLDRLGNRDNKFVPPFFDAAWVADLRSLQDFIPRDSSTAFAASRAITGISKTSLSPSVDLEGPRGNPFKSIVDIFEVVVDAKGTGNDYTPAERQQLKNEARELAKWGLKSVSQAILVAESRTQVAVEMQKQSSALFPDMLGDFTAYSNGFYKSAVAATKAQLKEAVMNPNSPNNPVMRQASAEVVRNLNELRSRWSRNKPLAIEYTTDKGFEQIPDKDWYEIGAKMGFFNLYAREFDAEANGLAMMAPEEFSEMYARWEEQDPSYKTPAKKEQILNQATFVFSRGIMEEGRVPKYKGDDVADPRPNS